MKTIPIHIIYNSKPVVLGNLQSKPKARAEHSCCKIGANEVAIFGGWAGRPMNDLWSFNFVDMEWRVLVSSGIQPRPRYRHTAEFIGSNMYILGGSDNNDDIPEQSRNLTIHVLSLTTMQWTHPTISGGFNPFPRSGHGSAVIGTVTIAIFGGKLNNQVMLRRKPLCTLYILYYAPLWNDKSYELMQCPPIKSGYYICSLL